jgi:hypothetical protein
MSRARTHRTTRVSTRSYKRKQLATKLGDYRNAIKNNRKNTGLEDNWDPLAE